ncbi:MAG TPA: hypothetical protein VGB73_20760 [Pyrinomonadaceae bacterium]|jgi:hypothetical protein
MQRKRLVAPGGIRRSLLLPALAALVLLVSFTTSCPGPGTNNNNGGVVTTQSPSPSPTQGAVPPPPPPMPSTDDRPIIISGGSLDLDFNPAYYQGSSGGGTFRSANNRITTMRVYDDDATDAAVGLCTVTFADASDITIAYSVAGGGSGNIRAVSTSGSAGNSVELTFNAAQLPKRNPQSNKHYNKKASIDSITYTGGSPATCDLGGKKKVTIELEGTPVACAATTTPTPTPTTTP